MAFSARLLSDLDEGVFRAFIAPHATEAYFIASNSFKAGLEFAGQTYQADYFGAFKGDALVGVLAHGWISNVQIFVTDLACVPALAAAWRQHLAAQPRKVEVFLGMRAHVTALLDAAGLGKDKFREVGGENEGLFGLDLTAMAEPAILARADVVVRLAEVADLPLLAQWRHDFNVEAVSATPGAACLAESRKEMEWRVRDRDLFVLEEKGVPVSMCGAGGFLPDCVMVGAVWTPPNLRGRGYAKAVTAGALNLARAKGITRALLFAKRADAIAVYRRLGFQRLGDWALDFLKEPRLTL